MIGELAAIAAAFCFAVAATVYRRPLMSTSAVSASIVRFTSTGAILVGIVLALWGFAPYTALAPQIVMLTMASGMVGLGVGDVLYMTGFKLVGVARTVGLVATYPMFSLGLEVVLGREEVLPHAAAGAATILVGVWLLMHRGAGREPVVSRDTMRRGAIAGLSTAFLYSVAMILLDEALASMASAGIEGAFALNALRTASGGMLLLLAAPLADREHGFLKLDRHSVALLLLGSLIAYGVGWYLLTWGFILAPAALVVPLSSITPLFATVTAVVFLRERLSTKGIIGVLLIVAGVLVLVVG